MNWKDYITPIQKSKISGDVAHKIVIDLFERAGSQSSIAEATAKSWLRGTRNCKASTHFPAGKADTNSLFRYFKNRPDGKLKHLQQIFRDNKDLNDDSSIDVETDDIDTFCWSLVNQFLDLLGFQRIDIPHADVPMTEKIARTSQLPNSQGDGIPKDATANQGQAVEERFDSMSSLDSAVSTDASNSGKRSIRSMILPHSDDCCYHCDHWKGNRSTFGAYTKALPGNCEWHGQQRLSSDSPCQNYRKRQSQPGDW